MNIGDSKLEGANNPGSSSTSTEMPKNNLAINGGNSSEEKTLFCPRHKQELLKVFCRACSVLVCKECMITDHSGPLHDCAHVSEVGSQQMEAIARTVQECRAKAADVRAAVKAADHTAARLQVQYHKAQNEINDTFQFYRSMLEERKHELLKELESVFSTKQISLGVLTQKANEMADKIQQTCDFVERLIKYTSVTDVLMVKKLLDSKLQVLLNYTPDIPFQTAADLEFVSNYQAIQVGVRNTFGYVRSNTEVGHTGFVGKQPPIARPTTFSTNCSSANNNNNSALAGAVSLGGLLMDRPYNSGLLSAASTCASSTSPSPFDITGNTGAVTGLSGSGGVGSVGGSGSSGGCVGVGGSSVITKRFSSANSFGPFSTTISDLNLSGMSTNPYEKWSSGGSDTYPIAHSSDHFPMPTAVSLTPNVASGDSMLDLTSKLMSSAAIFPLKSQIKRQKMIYHCKFGEFGVMEGQFTEPSGVAVNAQNDIIVADTNNHRIQIFDKEGRFKFQFGECGKRDGQLLYPNRVAVVRTSGDIIVTERSPTHQIQIYNQYGQFVRKFGANILQHPRGVTVDSKGRIVVVECKVMRVIIFDQAGNVLQKFGCSKHLEFPNGVVVNDKQEIFISDNRAHCVKVFNYDGAYLRQIGGEGITNYPIGVGINAAGEILIADNHNNFNLTIFTQDGQLVSALESKVKHAQCFDVALMDDGSVVLASKDYRLYIYRYVQVPPMVL